jgi:hypothetical protein
MQKTTHKKAVFKEKWMGRANEKRVLEK